MEEILIGKDGRLFQLLVDHQTVWVNADDGMAVGRFSKFGVDVHHDAETQMRLGTQCLACVHDFPPAEGWQVFVDKMEEHYGVRVPDDARPDFAQPAAPELDPTL